MDYVLTSVEDLILVILDSFLSIVGNIVLYAVLGFILTIFLMIYIARKKWAKRKNGLWNVLAKFHYILIFVGIMVSAPMLGGTRAIHTMAEDVVSVYLAPTLEKQLQNIQDMVVESWSEEVDNGLVSVKETSDKLIQSMHYEADKDEYFAESKTDMINWLIDELAPMVVYATVTSMVNLGMENDAEDLTFSITDLTNIDYSSSSKNITAAVEQSIGGQINWFFGVQYLGILSLLLWITGISIIEMLFYNLYWKKRKTSDLAVALNEANSSK